MYNRRKFLRQSGTFALASLLLARIKSAASFFGERSTRSIGITLYTLGKLMTTDAKGTLQKLAAIGYKELESAGSQKGNYYGYKPKEFAAIIKDAGMTWR